MPIMLMEKTQFFTHFGSDMCHISVGILNDLGSNFGIKFVLFCSLCIYFSDCARFWLVRVLIADLHVSSQVLGEKYEV